MKQAPKPDFRPTLLVCTPKHFGPAQDERAVAETAELVGALGVKARCVPSGDWFRKTFSQHGNWDSWVWETVHGKDYHTRALHFHGFVVHGQDVGRATAGIVKTALQSGRTVLASVDGRLYAVTAVAERDSNRWNDGWSLTLAAIGD